MESSHEGVLYSVASWSGIAFHSDLREDAARYMLTVLALSVRSDAISLMLLPGAIPSRT